MDPVLEKIKDFAAEAHKNQKRKFTNEPFINHPVRVMELCAEYTSNRPMLAAALLHDVIEDTEISVDELRTFLLKVMPVGEALRTVELVVDLTDVYVKEAFPELNRTKRKNREVEKLKHSDPDAQTVKYADSIDNTIDIARNDTDFAGRFLTETENLLSRMDQGDPALYQRATETVKNCLEALRKQKKMEFRAKKQRKSDQ